MPPRSARSRPPAARRLLADDVVPELRPRLAFLDPPRGLGVAVLRVASLATGEVLGLRGFECSLARMADGRRTAREVVFSAIQVGLPLSLEGLDAFLGKMAHHGLLTPRAPTRAPFPAEPREAWAQSTRELYRLALRSGREGNFEQAVATLDTLLEQAPATVDAHHLRHSLRRQLRSRETGLPFDAVFAQAQREWRRTADLAQALTD